MRLGRIDGETTANVGIIDGGQARNIVPETVKIEAEARSHNEEKLREQTEHMTDILQREAAEYGATTQIRQARTYTGFHLEPEEPVVARAVAAARQVDLEPVLHKGEGASDANIFNEHGIPSIVLATGARPPHTLEEYLHIPSLLQCLQWLLAIVTTNPQNS